MNTRLRVFVDIDTQNDFIEPNGALYVPGADSIKSKLAHLTMFAREHAIPILASACAHTPDDAALEPFPPHCLVDTWGQERIAETRWPGGLILQPDDRFLPTSQTIAHVTIEKRQYDLFSQISAAEVVAFFATKEAPKFVVYGVATDYCVRAAVLGLRSRGFDVDLVVDAIRAVDREHEPKVLKELVETGVLLTLTERVCEA